MHTSLGQPAAEEHVIELRTKPSGPSRVSALTVRGVSGKALRSCSTPARSDPPGVEVAGQHCRNVSGSAQRVDERVGLAAGVRQAARRA